MSTPPTVADVFRRAVRRVADSLRSPARWRLARWRRLLPGIEAIESEIRGQSGDRLKQRSRALQYRLRNGEPRPAVLPEAAALVREAARRSLGMRHFDVQILGGLAMVDGGIAEMETGEGKTLTATLPVCFHAMAGRGVHVVTTNDYLARRDAQWMTPIYDLLGLSVGVVLTGMNREERRRAYGCHVTYGTGKEFGFDFLRDQSLRRSLASHKTDRFEAAGPEDRNEKPVQREPYFALVDEVDSVLLDEARTPLILGVPPGEPQRRAERYCRWSASAARHFVRDEHYEFDGDRKTAELTAAGRQLLRELDKPEWLGQAGLFDLYEHLERALQARHAFHRNRQYIVRDGKVVIVDQATGRLAEGRKWRSGIHQAIEAAEGLEITLEEPHSARVIVQDFFRRYRYLAGMTGTASAAAGEFRKIYRLWVVPIPPNRPVRRVRMADRVFRSEAERWQAIVDEVLELHAEGRPVLIGTRSIRKSEDLSRLLVAAGVEHRVLNARRLAEEAEIVAEAGKRGRVTVSTNMAGRGTDIKLGPGVAELGGLHVICSETHESSRIDRQLVGRCARQGDPGSYRQYLTLEDEVLAQGLGEDAARRRAGYFAGRLPDPRVVRRMFRAAQKRIDRRHALDRILLLHREKFRQDVLYEMGLDPYLDAID